MVEVGFKLYLRQKFEERKFPSLIQKQLFHMAMKSFAEE